METLQPYIPRKLCLTTVILQTKEIHYKNPTFGDSFVKTSAVVILICLEVKNTVENIVEFP